MTAIVARPLASCRPVCGDGNVDPGEQCDDGNNVDGDSCSSTCELPPRCGDGNVDPGEQCDDGNNIDGDSCSSTCGPPPPQQLPDLSLTKTDAPDPVTVGTHLTYTITVTNNGPGNATGVTVTDPLPGGVTFVSATPSRGTCSGTATVTCPLGGLANGESATVAIVVTPTSGGALSNTASVAGEQGETNPGNNAHTETTTVNPLPPPQFVIGARVQVVNETINVRATPGGTLLGAQPVGSLGTVLAGPEVTPNGVTWYQIDYDNGVDGWSGQDNLDNVDDDLTLPPTVSDLDLRLTDIPDPLTVNGQLTYTITVTNNGPGIATGVQVVDSLPSGALNPRLNSSQGECSSAVTVVCDLGMLAAGARATVTINVIPTVIGDLSNAAHVTAFETDPNPANNSSTETTTVQSSDPARADLAITAEVAVGPRVSDQGFTYLLTVRNGGPATATDVLLTNDLPQGIDLDQITASQSNCSGRDPMLCDLGTLTSGAKATVRIDVVRIGVVGTLPNQATVNLDQHDPNTANNFAFTSALDLPTPQTACDSKRCRLKITCNRSDLLKSKCKNKVTLFVDTRAGRDTRARRLSDERASRSPKLVPFAAASTNFPGGKTKNVPLKLTSKGQELKRKLEMQGKKKRRGGEMRISNTAGGIDIIPLIVRLK